MSTQPWFILIDGSVQVPSGLAGFSDKKQPTMELEQRVSVVCVGRRTKQNVCQIRNDMIIDALREPFPYYLVIFSRKGSGGWRKNSPISIWRAPFVIARIHAIFLFFSSNRISRVEFYTEQDRQDRWEKCTNMTTWKCIALFFIFFAFSFYLIWKSVVFSDHISLENVQVGENQSFHRLIWVTEQITIWDQWYFCHYWPFLAFGSNLGAFEKQFLSATFHYKNYLLLL